MESDNGPLFHSLEFSPQEMPEFSLRIEGVVYYYTILRNYILGCTYFKHYYNKSNIYKAVICFKLKYVFYNRSIISHVTKHQPKKQLVNQRRTLIFGNHTTQTSYEWATTHTLVSRGNASVEHCRGRSNRNIRGHRHEQRHSQDTS